MGFTLPTDSEGRWETFVDTRERTGQASVEPLQGGSTFELEARSMAVLRQQRM